MTAADDPFASLPTITEVKRTLDGRIDRFVCRVAARSDEEVVLLYRIPAGRDVHGVDLPAGTATVGYFWTDLPFNLYHWVGPDGVTLAHYFNIGDVAGLAGDVLTWDDLAVDILATPDGRVRVLDEDELPADLDPARRRYVEDARDDVLRRLPDLIRESEARTVRVLASLPTSSTSSTPSSQPRSPKTLRTGG